MFDWLGSNLGWTVLIIAALLVVFGIVVMFVLRRRSRGSVEPENLLEALQLLNTSRMDDAVLKVLVAQLPDWPVSTEITRAVKELQALRVGIDVATRSGTLAAQAVEFKQNTLKALDQMWRLSERVATSGAQKVEYGTVESGLQDDLAQVRRVRETAKQTRVALAQVTKESQDEEGGSLDEATASIRELAEAAGAMRKANL
jgi:hypothetical protein